PPPQSRAPLTLMTAPAPTSTPGPGPSVDDVLDAARIQVAAGRLGEAVALLELTVQSAPDSVAARHELGALLITLRRPREAEDQFRVALVLQPNNVDTQVNLGNALHAQGQLESAESVYRQALALDARHVRGLVSLGNLLSHVRRPAEASELLSQAAALAPGVPAVHNFLGNALRDLARIDDAAASYGRALAIDPGHPDANENLGGLLKVGNHLEQALACYRASGNPFARAQALDCELRLGRYDAFFAWLEQHADEEAANLHSAPLSAYAAFHQDRADPHRFCPHPLTHVRISDRYTGTADAPFLQQLIREAGQLEALWEPRGVTTKSGFQTGGNLFTHATNHPESAIARLQRDLLVELARYREALVPAGLVLETRWPAVPRVQGWYVRLLSGGHQSFHNHPFGWLSGVVYLQMPRQAAAGEGAIEFGLEGSGFPRLSERLSPTLLHQPAPGQLALFPSSLFHRTIPFRSDEERLCIAFDLLPEPS
ncbi:MAG: putative 2OG-Fe(II) oxygenase, partial [Gammaproteobacteria bacterium]